MMQTTIFALNPAHSFRPGGATTNRPAWPRALAAGDVLADRCMSIAPLTAIDTIVTDGPSDHPALVAARGAGVEVICVAGHADISDGIAGGQA